MSIIPFTLFVSLLLAGLFILLFARDQRLRRFASAESDSLLPLTGEKPHEIVPPQTSSAHDEDHHHHDHDDHDHDHGHDHSHADGSSCGCRNGTRPPCSGCRKRAAPGTASLSR